MTKLGWIIMAVAGMLAIRDGCVVVRNAWRQTWNQGVFLELVIATTVALGIAVYLVLP